MLPAPHKGVRRNEQGDARYRWDRRRFNSRSTASRMKSERFSPSARALSIRASVPSGNRAGVCSPLIRGRPTSERISDISFCAKPCTLLISPIDRVNDISYIDDISYGGKQAMSYDRRPNDIKAPDGYTLGGERRVRKDGTVLFNRGWWQLPEGFAERGEYVWVHEKWITDSRGKFGSYSDLVLEVAPPGYRNFSAAVLDGETINCRRTRKPDAKPAYRDPARKAWAHRSQAAAR